MRSFFSGNRRSAPLGPPHSPPPSPPKSATKGETIQALRQRQRDKQRQFVLQMMRAEKDKELAQHHADAARARDAEATRRAMSDMADALSMQITTLERIMHDVGLQVDIDDDARANRQLLEESREMYEEGLAEAEQHIAEHVAQGEYMTTMASPFMMPSDVYDEADDHDDEDRAMADLDEVAKQTGRT